MCWGFFKSYGWAASECCIGPDSTLVKNSDNISSNKINNNATEFTGFDKNNLSFDSINKQINDLDVSTGKDQAVFYSGNGAREAAENFASKNNLTTLEQTVGGKALDDLKLFEGTVPDIDGGRAADLFGSLSSNYANQAAGKVTAIINNPRPTSIFLTKELPALLKNSNVTEVVVRSASGKSVSIPKGTTISDALEMIKGF